MSGSVTISSSGVPARFRSMPRLADEVLVQRLAGVFLQVGAHQAHRLLLLAEEELDLAALHHRDLELADLVALGQVGVEVVLAREHAARRDVRADRQAELDGAFDRALVHHRQRAGQGQVDRRRPACWARRRRRSDARLKILDCGGELGVGLEADHDFVALDQSWLVLSIVVMSEPCRAGAGGSRWPAGTGAPRSAAALPAK